MFEEISHFSFEFKEQVSQLNSSTVFSFENFFALSLVADVLYVYVFQLHLIKFLLKISTFSIELNVYFKTVFLSEVSALKPRALSSCYSGCYNVLTILKRINKFNKGILLF